MKDFLKYLLWVVCATVWVTLFFILPDFSDNPISDIRTALTISAYLLALGGASFWLLYLLGLNRIVAWISLPILGIGGSIVSYYRVAFHATITPMIIDATIHTNAGTVAGVVSWQLFAWIAVNILIAVGFVFWRQKRIHLSYAWRHAIVALILLLVYYNANGRLRSSINQRYPYNIGYSLIEYCKEQQTITEDRNELSYEVVDLPDSITVIFVLGEAMRADHLSLNDYARPTTPLLLERSNLISFRNIYSEYTYTSTSVPHILSPADSIHPEWSSTHSSFIRTFNHNQFKSVWISNQDNGRTYSTFLHEADSIIFPNASKSSYVFDPWYDEQLLPHLDLFLSIEGARKIGILHMIGSHWYYDLHVPRKWQQFTPGTSNRIITNNSTEQIINSYDNTALYLDAFLDSIIQRVESTCAILIYLSDHGEALGENGNWLHAGDAEPLHHPACIVWYSNKYAELFPQKVEALQRNAQNSYRTDFLYYSILSAVGIQAEGNNPKVDIFSLD